MVAAFVVVAKGVALLKELVVARAFGRSDELEAFLIALLAASFVVSVLAASLSSVLVPAYVAARETEGAEAAAALLGTASWTALAALGVAAGVLAWTSGRWMPWLASGFEPQKLELARRLFLAMLPVLLLSGLATVWASVLQAQGRFGTAALGQVFVPLVTLVFLLVGAGMGIMALTAGTVAGHLAEAAVTGWGLRRAGGRLLGRPGGLKQLRTLVRGYPPVAAAALLMAASALVDQALAARLEAGSVAALGYGGRVVAVMTTLAGGLAVAILPHFSLLAARGEREALRASLVTWQWRIVVAGLPVTVLLALMSEPVVRLLFERGAFTAADTAAVAQVQALLLLQLPVYTLNLLGLRLLHAMGRHGLALLTCGLFFGANLTLDLLLMGPWGVSGIAVATTLAYAASAAAVAAMLRPALRAA